MKKILLLLPQLFVTLVCVIAIDDGAMTDVVDNDARPAASSSSSSSRLKLVRRRLMAKKQASSMMMAGSTKKKRKKSQTDKSTMMKRFYQSLQNRQWWQVMEWPREVVEGWDRPTNRKVIAERTRPWWQCSTTRINTTRVKWWWGGRPIITRAAAPWWWWWCFRTATRARDPAKAKRNQLHLPSQQRLQHPRLSRPWQLTKTPLLPIPLLPDKRS